MKRIRRVLDHFRRAERHESWLDGQRLIEAGDTLNAFSIAATDDEEPWLHEITDGTALT